MDYISNRRAVTESNPDTNLANFKGIYAGTN
jgi:hypothetical protein